MLNPFYIFGCDFAEIFVVENQLLAFGDSGESARLPRINFCSNFGTVRYTPGLFFCRIVPIKAWGVFESSVNRLQITD
jgi:hypothetical protein